MIAELRSTWSRARVARLVAWLLLALALALVGSALIGVEHVDLLRALREPGSIDGTILWKARLPRVVLGALIGASLAPAGVAFQSLLSNPLADPYVLGISGGAAAAGTVALVLFGASGFSSTFVLPVAAFAGALASVALVFALGRVRGVLIPTVALLAGVVWNALTSALIVGIRLIATPAASHEVLYWLTGSISSANATPLMLAGLSVYVVIGLVLLRRDAIAMNALILGTDTARSLGIDVARARRRVFFASSLLTGGAVALVGPIGFVGIVVPHSLRFLIGGDHRAMLWASAIGGAIFLVGADTIARLSLLAVGVEPTVGVITALIGAPFFLVLLVRRGRKGAPL